MTGIMNGLILHGGIKPYSGTFLTFPDYARNAVRMAALMDIPTILVYSHDSIGVGEDGPTHQPIEHLTSLRTTPNLETWRPCDTSETAISWLSAITSLSKPTALILSRQNLPTFSRNDSQIKSISKGAYILHEPESEPELILIATGSEVKLAMEDHVTRQDVMNMLFMTQHYETVSKLGEHNSSTIFMPYSPDNVGDLQMQIQSSLIAVEEMKNKKKENK